MPLPILSVAQVRDWEKRTWDAGITVDSVIEQAGQAVAQLAAQVTQSGDSILLLAGKGNNGSDTRIAAKHLSGRQVKILDVTDPSEDLAVMRQCLQEDPVLVVDGLFGIGLNRELDEHWQKLIHCLNETDAPVLSVDCPSGVDADNGIVQGAAIEAAITLCLGGLKPGLLVNSAAKYVGQLRIASRIGLDDPAPEADSHWVTGQDMRGMRPQRNPASHKGSHGHVGIIGGSTGFHGAPILAGCASLRAHPGLVSIFTPAYQPVSAQCQSVMVHPWGRGCMDALSRVSALVAGPGLAGDDIDDSLRQTVLNLWNQSGKPMVIDASALDWVPKESPESRAFRLLTPHPGEAARLLDCSVDEVESDRLRAARALAEQFGVTVLLKGRHTILTQANGPALVNSTGNVGLAQGGSGDVLAGFIGGLLGQPVFRGREIQAVTYAAWKHGWAADQLTAVGDYWGMDDLINALGKREFH